MVVSIETPNGSGQSTAGSSGLRLVMRQHPLFLFFLLAYLISWIFLTPSVLSAWGILPGDFLITFVIHTFGPTLAAIIMVSMLEGKTGLQSLRQRVRQLRAGWQWYVFILVGIPALIVLGIIIQPGALASFKGLTAILPLSYLVNFVAVWFGGGPLGEEIGWRGFALPRMQPLYGPLWGTILLGVLWCFWHLPEFWMPSMGGGPGTGLGGFALTNLLMFLPMVVAIAIIFTWVFNHTQGSVFVSITAHASFNIPQVVLVPLFLAVNYTSLLLANLIGFGVPALLIIILTRGRLGYQSIQDL
jgi:membrane protease YdiL (CAAX protease family)